MRASGLTAVIALTLTLAGVGAAERDRAPVTADEALRTGNRLFRRGEVADAVAAYRQAEPAALASDPVLAYNLATALHRLGQLPEAILWYRRAARRLGDDPWLRDNLELARSTLAAPRIGPAPALAPVLLHPWLLPAAAALAAWAALALQAVALRRRRPSRRPAGPVAALLGLAALLWITHLALPRIGPRPAVLLAPCADSLPAGSEVWARPVDPGTGNGPASWRVRGPRGALLCPGDAVAPL